MNETLNADVLLLTLTVRSLDAIQRPTIVGAGSHWMDVGHGIAPLGEARSKSSAGKSSEKLDMRRDLRAAQRDVGSERTLRLSRG
jgi:hypothetical protein